MLARGGKIYVSGDVEIDTGRILVRQAGEERRLRPKTFLLLLYLIEHRDRLVPKEELIEQLWQGVAVSDGALSQCVADIRRALGEDARNPRYIRTAPRLGYQFIGPLDESTVPSVLLEEITEERVEYSEEITDDEPVALLPPPPAPKWRWPAMALALAALALAAVWIARPHAAPETSDPGIRTAVFQFENRSGKPEMDWLRIGLADMLATSLSASPRIALITPGQLQRGLRQPFAATVDLEEALRAARQAGARAMILGAFGSLGESVRLDTQLYDVASGRLLGGESVTVETPGLLLARVDPVAERLATRLGAPMATQAHLAEVMTNNLEAYRLYSLGLGRTRALRLPEAIELYQKAIDLDPGFAMAYARIGYAYSVAWAIPARGKPFLEKAYRLSDRLTARDRMFIRAWYAMASLDYEGAERAYREILKAYPLEVEVYVSLAGLVAGEDHPQEAQQILQRGLAIEPDMPDMQNTLTMIYLDLGQQDKAIESARRYLALAPNEPNALDTLGLAQQAFGHYDEARDSYREALRRKPDFEIALVHLANLDFQVGRYRSALDLYSEYTNHAPSDAERVRGHSSAAWVYWRKGDFAAAQREADAAGNMSEAQMLLAESGKLRLTPAVRQQLLGAPRNSNRRSRESFRSRYYVAGLLALREHRDAEALDLFRSVLQEQSVYWFIDPMETCLGDAFLELGRLDEAIAEYRRVLALNPNYPMALYRLALALDGKGMRSEAHAEFTRFLAVWKNADSDIPELIDARRRLH